MGSLLGWFSEERHQEAGPYRGRYPILRVSTGNRRAVSQDVGRLLDGFARKPIGCKPFQRSIIFRNRPAGMCQRETSPQKNRFSFLAALSTKLNRVTPFKKHKHPYRDTFPDATSEEAQREQKEALQALQAACQHLQEELQAGATWQREARFLFCFCHICLLGGGTLFGFGFGEVFGFGFAC